MFSTEIQWDLLVEKHPVAGLVRRMLWACRNTSSSPSSTSSHFGVKYYHQWSSAGVDSQKCKATRTADGSKTTIPKPNHFAYGIPFWKCQLWCNEGKHQDVREVIAWWRRWWTLQYLSFVLLLEMVKMEKFLHWLGNEVWTTWLLQEGMDRWCGVKMDMGPKPVCIMGVLLCPLQASTVPAADSALWEVWAGDAGLWVHHLGQLWRRHRELRPPAGAGAQALLQWWSWAGQPGRGSWGLADGFWGSGRR